MKVSTTEGTCDWRAPETDKIPGTKRSAKVGI